jgi:hypothetical protein
MTIVKTIALNLTGHTAIEFKTKGPKLTSRVMIALAMIARVRNGPVRNGHSKVIDPAKNAAKNAVKTAVQHPHRNCALKMVRQANVPHPLQFLNPPQQWWRRSLKRPLQRQSHAHRVRRNPWHLPRPKASLTSN